MLYIPEFWISLSKNLKFFPCPKHICHPFYHLNIFPLSQKHLCRSAQVSCKMYLQKIAQFHVLWHIWKQVKTQNCNTFFSSLLCKIWRKKYCWFQHRCIYVLHFQNHENLQSLSRVPVNFLKMFCHFLMYI